MPEVPQEPHEILALTGRCAAQLSEQLSALALDLVHGSSMALPACSAADGLRHLEQAIVLLNRIAERVQAQKIEILENDRD